jgi:sterol desaturase/sphingolipid hydroxylase (fatty acid hydroxylase superfamily)
MPEFLSAALASTWAITKVMYLVFAGGLLLERLAPAERGQPFRHVFFNLWYTPLFLFLTALALPPLQSITAPWVAAYGGWVPIRLPDTPLGAVALGLAYMAVYDFFYYWFHRAQHEVPWLWAQHKLHHSDRSLNVSTSGRHHWLEEPLRVFLMLLPMALVFDVSAPGAGWMATALLLWPFFIHLNARLSLGPLTPVFAGPQVHRIHHSRLPEHHDRNYAAFFPFWDVLFGSYYAPKPGEYPPTGLDDGEDLNTPVKALLSPFRDWWGMLRRRGRVGV